MMYLALSYDHRIVDGKEAVTFLVRVKGKPGRRAASGAGSLMAVKYAGVAYLLYLAWQTLKDSGPLELKADKSNRKSMMATVRTGFLINILNPKLTVFFLAFLPQFVSPQAANPTLDMALLGGVFMAMTFAVFIVYGMFAALVGEKVLRSDTVMLWMRRAVATAFAGFGLRLALAEQ
jgi:threonine/homoserine/homoserine lactone efflux protein